MSKRRRRVDSLLSDEMNIGGTYWQDTQEKIKDMTIQELVFTLKMDVAHRMQDPDKQHDPEKREELETLFRIYHALGAIETKIRIEEASRSGIASSH